MGGFKLPVVVATASRTTRRSAQASANTTTTTTTSRSGRSSGLNSTVSGRGRSGRGGGRGRGRGRTTLHPQEEEEEEEARPRRHEYYEEEDDDPQGEYREEGGVTIGDIYIPPVHKREEPTLQGERLVIQKIICENFKSYGGVKEMGPFHKSFSSIIGPNGNGKSNIIDAMLFVFGYKASKIRCKKVSVLIHKSELLPDVQSCAVSVIFCKILDNGEDDDSFQIVPGSEIRVKRRADVRNNSTYYYNDRPVKFQDVAEFLKAAGIDIVHNRFLILQGEVEQIAQMPAMRKNQNETGLLEFLEEVIGTKRYLKCLCQLNEKVEELNFTRESKLQYVDIVERERRELMEPVKLAKEFLRKKNSLCRFQHTRCQIKIDKVKDESKELQDSRQSVQEHYEQITSRLDEINQISSERNAKYTNKEKELKELEAQRDQMKQKVSEAEAKFSKTHEQIQRSNTQRKKIMSDITKTKEELEILEQLPANHEKDLAELTKKRDEIESKVEREEKAVEGLLAKLQTQIDIVSREKETADQNFLKLKKVRDEKKNILQKLESELKIYKEQEGLESRKLETLEEELKALEERLRLKEREARSSMGDKVEPMKVKVKQKEEELLKIKVDLGERKKQVDHLHAKVESAKEAMAVCSSNDVVGRAFEAEKKKGNLLGVYGRLKDLATIDEVYNVAATVSTSLWENWVCDNDDTASDCIKFLKAKGLDFQNFLPLNRLSHYDRDINRPFNPPQNSKRIFDLLKLKTPEVARAFYKGLRNTLVVENLDVAQRIGYGSNPQRVATLRGDLIDPSGLMTGGGRQRIIPKMNSQAALSAANRISPQEFQELQNNCQQADSQYEDLCKQVQTLQSEISNYHMKIREYENKLGSSKTDIESTRNQIKLKQARVAEQKAILQQCKTDPKILIQKEKDCELASEAFDEANEPCETAQEQASEVEEKLKDLQQTRRKEIRKKLDSLLEQKKKIVNEIDKLNVELKNFSKNQAKLQSKITNLESEKEKLEHKMREMNELKQKLTEEGIENKNKMDEVTLQAAEAKTDLKELKKNLCQFGGEKVELDKEKVKIENDLGNVNAKLETYNSKIAHYENEMNQLKLEEVPDEEVEPCPELSSEELKAKNLKDLEQKISKLTSQLKNEQPNLGVLDQYKQKTREFLEKVKELDAVTVERDKFRDAYVRATQNRLSEFMEGFAIISFKLKEMFRMISMGGDAELELCDSGDPFASGVEMVVRPARKSWNKIRYLSGGEKTLSSLALIFALHYFKPSPFYVMDEIDAALDFKNVSIIANYIKDRTKFTQFIIISLRSNMFELADSMLGVYKVDNMSYSIHLGVGKLLENLHDYFRDNNKPFPFATEYLQNNRAERRKDVEKYEAKQKAAKALADGGLEEDGSPLLLGPEPQSQVPPPLPQLFNANISIIPEESVSHQNGTLGHPDEEIETPADPTGEIRTEPEEPEATANSTLTPPSTPTTTTSTKRPRSPPTAEESVDPDEMNESKRSRISDSESEEEEEEEEGDE